MKAFRNIVHFVCLLASTNALSGPPASVTSRRQALHTGSLLAAAAAFSQVSPALADRVVPPPIALLEATLGDTVKQAEDREIAAKEAKRQAEDDKDAREERLAAAKEARQKAKEELAAARAAKGR